MSCMALCEEKFPFFRLFDILILNSLFISMDTSPLAFVRTFFTGLGITITTLTADTV